MEELAKRFEARLQRSVEISRSIGYTPTVFIGMLARHGGRETAKRLIAAGEIQSGLQRMAELGRLDITMERIMLEAEFAPLFTQGELDAARWRLEQLA